MTLSSFKLRFKILPFLMISAMAYSQMPTDIHIGQKADSVQYFVGREIQTDYNAGGWLIKMTAQTIDYKGTIKEVIFCKENLLIPYFNKGVNTCTHFLMENDTLSRIVTNYQNLSLQEVKYLMVMSRLTNMSNYYFVSDFRFYHHIYKSEDGQILDDFRKTRKDQLPLSVLEQLHMIAGKW